MILDSTWVDQPKGTSCTSFNILFRKEVYFASKNKAEESIKFNLKNLEILAEHKKRPLGPVRNSMMVVDRLLVLIWIKFSN